MSTVLTRSIHPGVLAYDRVHGEMLRAVAEGSLSVNGLESLITRRINLEDFVEGGIRALIHEKDKHGESLYTNTAWGTESIAFLPAVKILVSPTLREESTPSSRKILRASL